jgi:hypothetical protein
MIDVFSGIDGGMGIAGWGRFEVFGGDLGRDRIALRFMA